MDTEFTNEEALDDAILEVLERSSLPSKLVYQKIAKAQSVTYKQMRDRLEWLREHGFIWWGHRGWKVADD